MIKCAFQFSPALDEPEAGKMFTFVDYYGTNKYFESQL